MHPAPRQARPAGVHPITAQQPYKAPGIPHFSWLPDGPIQRFFNQQAHNEYFRSRFDRRHEHMVVVNGMLSRNSSAAMVSG